MQFTLKNKSIRFQILLPVAFTAISLFISLWIAMSNLKSEQTIIDANTKSFVFYKDKVVEIDDEIYSLRIDAVYAIYDNEHRADFIDNLEKRREHINVLLNELKIRKTFANEVNQISLKINDYAAFSKKLINYLDKKEKNIEVSENYDALIAQYRSVGDSMINAINHLSQQVNKFSDIVMNESYDKNIQVQNTAATVVMSVFIVSLLISWWLSNLIVHPIQKLQLVIRKLAEGNLTIRTDIDGENEIAQLSQDINTTAIQLQATIEELHNINQSVASASTELAAVMNEAELNSQKELCEIEQVASAV
ncbi:HAMP domain-containing protein, partial [Aliivibrio fischeri]